MARLVDVSANQEMGIVPKDKAHGLEEYQY
jgi:hypothetical protein